MSILIELYRNLKRNDLYIIFVALGILAGILKIIGGLMYFSKAVLIDAATSMANIASIILINYFLAVSMKPPDKDHLYGHVRMRFGGEFFTILLYSFVAGLMLPDLIEGLETPYKVDVRASMLSSAGMMLYAVSIYLGIRMGRSFATYVRLTSIEIIEGIIALSSSLAGALVSYLIDLTGAYVLYIYLIRELLNSSKRFIYDISDGVEEEIVEKVMRIVGEFRLRIKSIRLRKVYEGLYQGDLVIFIKGDEKIHKAHEIAEQLERRLSSERIYVSIHMEPE
ncbi:MAG: cation transporter [Sulfolobales archaeon]